MKQISRTLLISFFIMVASLLFILSVKAQDISPGIDLWWTPTNFSVSYDFSNNPVPADFFGPGSDPFDGIVEFQSDPLSTSPPLNPTDIIIRRLQTATLPQCGHSDTVDIEIVALSLVSTDLITITYNGGQNPDPLWAVKVCLSGTNTQSPGSMAITKNCNDGGSFSADFSVVPQFIFIDLSPYTDIVFDNGLSIITYNIANGHWLYSVDGYPVIASSGGTVNHDCVSNTPDIMFGLSSNFFPGVRVVPCDCQNPVSDSLLRMVPIQSSWGPSGFFPPIPILSLPDNDDDHIPDIADNCPEDYNPYQEDTDDNGIGDICDSLSGCEYVAGDVNGSDSYNGLDITYGVNFFKGGLDPICPFGSCPISPCHAFFYCGDVNGSCSYNGLDITYGVNYFKGGNDPIPCPDCPPVE